MASKTPGGRGFQLRCLQEHPEGVLLGFSPPNLEPGLRAKKRVSQFGLPHPVEAQPSRGESISFLSPARAAGAPTFCDATESRQRTQPRGLTPPWITPAFSDRPPGECSACRPPEALRAWALRPAMRSIAKLLDPSSAKISPWRAGRLPLGRPAILAALDAKPPGRPTRKTTPPLLRAAASGKSYELRRVARPARGGGGSRDPKGRNYWTYQLIPGCPTRENCSAPQSLAARLGKYFRFNSSLKRSISLLRRGARILCKPFFVRALAEIGQNNSVLFGQFPTPAVARG